MEAITENHNPSKCREQVTVGAWPQVLHFEHNSPLCGPGNVSEEGAERLSEPEGTRRSAVRSSRNVRKAAPTKWKQYGFLNKSLKKVRPVIDSHERGKFLDQN